MVECQHCGTAAPEGRTMCPNCRRRVAPAVVQVPAPPRGLEPPPPPSVPVAVAGPASPSPTAASPNRGALAGWLVAFLAIAGLLSIWAVAAELHRASLAISAADGGGFTVQQLHQLADADDGVAAAVGTQLVGLLVAGVLFIIWLYRLCKRIHAARPGAFRHGIGWAIGGWFVPIWSLFRPKQMVDDAWRGSEEARGELPAVPPWVHLWWAAWLISGVLAWGVSRQYGNDTLRSIATADRVAAVGDAVSALAAALAIALVWGLSRRAAAVPVMVAGQASTAYRFNPPPGWPAPPEGWVPPPSWRPDPSWPAAPAGWQLWVPR